MARKLEPNTEPTVAGDVPNVTQDTFLQAVADIVAHNQALALANEKRKAARKKWKAAGIELKVIDRVIKKADWDRDEVRHAMDTEKQYMKWLGLPVGTQGELFEAGDREALLLEWEGAGYTAGLLGKSRAHPDNCPDLAKDAWVKGWERGDEETWKASGKEPRTLEEAAAAQAKHKSIKDKADRAEKAQKAKAAAKAKSAEPKDKPADPADGDAEFNEAEI